VAQVEGNVLVQEGEMSDVVAVVMGEENGIDIGLFIGQVGEAELGAGVEARDLGNEAEFKVALEAVRGAGLEIFVEVILAGAERFTEVEVDLGERGLEEEFIAADLARAAVEGQRNTRLSGRHGSEGEGIIEEEGSQFSPSIFPSVAISAVGREF
jgi:hypothetical protein